MDAVLHIAGIGAESPPELTFERINVEGTRALLDEARAAGVRRFVLVSSLGAERGSSAYHRSKKRAEELTRAFPREWVIVRPGSVYGPGDDVISTLLKMTRALPAVPLIGAGDQPFEPTWHEDLARALAACMERDDVIGRVLQISGGERTSMSDVVKRLGTLEGRDPLRLPLPETLVKAAQVITSGLGLPFPVDDTKLTLLEEENVVRGKNALPELIGGRPTSLDDGLKRLIASLPEQVPQEGVGGLRRKRFWGDIEGAAVSPRTLRDRFVRSFARVVPMETGGAARKRRPLRVGDDFTMELPLRGTVSMRVLETSPDRLTFLTLDGHPLAGAVSFLFSRGPRFEVQAHFRFGSTLDSLAMTLGGSLAQDATWTGVVERAAELSGGRLAGPVREESQVLEGEEAARVERWLTDLVSERKRRSRSAGRRKKPAARKSEAPARKPPGRSRQGSARLRRAG
jgi:nucleoside-diphosphate-sugar epimerase